MTIITSYELSELEFQNITCSIFQKLFDMVENADIEQVLECDSYDGILSIGNKDATYLITKHNPSKQIWIASPLKGGLHFSYDVKSSTWLDKGNHELITVIQQEIKELFGIVI